jgi:hypothetical protein
VCEKCGGTEYISIEKPSGGFIVQPCSNCKPLLYKKWLKKQAAIPPHPLEPRTPLSGGGDGGDAVAISLLATAEALVALHEAKFEMSVMGLIGDSIKIAEDKLKVALPDWARPIVEKLMMDPIAREKEYLRKEAEELVVGPMVKRAR